MIDDKELFDKMEFWFDHYQSNGDKHNDKTPDWKIIEYYFDMCLERVLNELPEMGEDETNEIIERINKMY